MQIDFTNVLKEVKLKMFEFEHALYINNVNWSQVKRFYSSFAISCSFLLISLGCHTQFEGFVA